MAAGRPLVLSCCSQVAGIVAAHQCFYAAFWTVPRWLDMALWGLCLVVALAAAALYRRSCAAPLFSSHWAFAILACLFFFLLGFARYSAMASEMQTAWRQMDRPPVNRGNPDEFDYRLWRWLQGPAADASSPATRLRSAALGLRRRLVGQYAAVGLEDEELALVSAVTLGDRSGVSRTTRDLYAQAGASHLLALSGLHLSVLVGLFLTWLNGRFVLSRWRVGMGALLVAFIWCYTLVAGLPASLVRAALMTSVFVVASLVHRRVAPLHLLVLTAWLMLLCRPFWLFDIGTQLSFAAMAGILLLGRALRRWAFGRWRFTLYRLQRYHLAWLPELLGVSLSAQLFTLPLVAFYFHRVPLYAPLFSLVFIPLATVMIHLAALTLAVSFVLPSAAALLSSALSWLLAAQFALMRFEVSLPGAVVPDFWSRKVSSELVVYHNRRCPALHLIATPSQSWLLTPQPDRVADDMHLIATTFWERRLTAAPVVLRGRSEVSVGGFRVAMAGPYLEAAGAEDIPPRPQAVDILWIVYSYPGRSLEEAASRWQPRLLVLDASLSQGRRRAMAREAVMRGWAVYDVARQGALKLRLPASEQ